MASGNYYVVGDYVPVAANAITTMSANTSGGETVIAGYYINWTEDGITSKGWEGLIAHSLFSDKEKDDILKEIQDNGNLNTLFSRLSGLDYEERQKFEDYIVGIYGSTTNAGGCIGDPL